MNMVKLETDQKIMVAFAIGAGIFGVITILKTFGVW